MLHWFDNLKLQIKFIIPVALLLLVGLAALGGVLMRVHSVNEAVKGVVRSQEQLTNLQQSLLLLQQQELIEKNYLLTGELAYTDRHTELNEEVDTYLQLAKEYTTNPDDLAAIESIETEMDGYHTNFMQLVSLKQQERHDEATQLTLQTSDLAVRQMHETVIGIMSNGKAWVAAKEAEAAQERQEAVSLTIVSALIFALVGVGAAFISRRTAVPILAITAAASAVENEDYESMGLDTIAERQDELGQLARVFSRMAAEVYRREKQLKEQVQTLKIEIDSVKRNQEVAEITESEYFQQLQEQAKELRRRNQED